MHLEFTDNEGGTISAAWVHNGEVIRQLGYGSIRNLTSVYILYTSCIRQPKEMDRFFRSKSVIPPIPNDHEGLLTVKLTGRLLFDYYNRADSELLVDQSKHYCREVLGILVGNEPREPIEIMDTLADIIPFKK